MIKFARNGDFLIIIDDKLAKEINLTREESKNLARFLLVELNCVEFILNDGRKGSEIDRKFNEMLDLRWGNGRKKF